MSHKRKHKFAKKFSFIFLLIMILQIFAPSAVYALTSGPSQPEVQAFEPFGTSEMVDLFSGDFTYNIPLFELPGPNGGYPFNLAYHSGVGMDQEASWVGLGWSLNPGAVNRTMRGLPDEFNGENIIKTLDMKKNWTVGTEASISLPAELWTFDMDNAGLSASFSLKVYYNSYRGVGIATNAGVNFGTANKNGANIGLGLSLNVDNQEGATITPSLTLSNNFNESGSDKNTLSGTISMGFNSKSGATGINLGLSYSESMPGATNADGTTEKGFGTAGVGGSSNISFAQSAYSPTIGTPMSGFNLSLSMQLGGDLGGAIGSLGFSGFYNEQTLKNKNVSQKAYGYLNLQNASEEDLLDFNREKDGAVSKDMPNLGIPSLTYDIYNIQGQGVGGMYRAYRNDIGSVSNSKLQSIIGGGALGFEFALGTNYHVAINADVNITKNLEGRWTGPYDAKYGYTNKESGSNYENVYFKRPGENVSQDIHEIQTKIGGYDPVTIKIKGKKKSPILSDQFSKSGIQTNNERKQSERFKRNISVLPIKFSEKVALPEFNSIKTYDLSEDYTTSATHQVSSQNANHFTGMSVLNTNGSRYIYGLPAYNKVHKDVMYSTMEGATQDCGPFVEMITENGKAKYKYDNSPIGMEDYYSNTETPAYAHAYLLTSILGTDYIDITNNGPTDDDFGYWVKFSYVQTADNFEWRSPYSGANFIQAHNSIDDDDKASYTYGEKEIWHVAKVETKTHVAVFNISERKDAKSANGEFAIIGSSGDKSSYKLDEINLYVKSEFNLNGSNAKIIKSINFDYNYDLCQGVENNDGSDFIDHYGTSQTNNGGKLTLKKVWFENGSSTRGALNPYFFSYNENTSSENPNYNQYAVDRWGNYKPQDPTGICFNLDVPYVNQKDPNKDINAAVWNLKNIKMPSGGEINVEYEADDYAYVQDKISTQMFTILGTKVDENNIYNNIGHIKSALVNGSIPKGKLYYPHLIAGSNEAANQANNYDNYKMYIELQSPVLESFSTAKRKVELDKYFEGITQIYYKILLNLNEENNENIKENISGYINIPNFVYGVDYGFDTYCLDDNNSLEFNKAWIKLPETKHGFNPVAMNGLQYLKYVIPQISNTIGVNNGSNTEIITALFGMIQGVVDLFSNFYDTRTAIDKNFCNAFYLGKSFIKLNNPNLTKVGGGLRVKQISINDNWASSQTGANNSEYGQRYEYNTIKDGTSEVISSGVAIYEPIIGGDENPLKYAKMFNEKPKIRTPHNLMFELPINESYYPAPSVGYSKVTVKSINTDNMLKNVSNVGLSSTGVTENEFYTAKDFPIIAKETTLEKRRSTNDSDYNQDHDTDYYKEYNLIVPIPGLGSVNINKIALSQGYSLELNDMHGKQKGIKNYGLNSYNEIEEEPYSWVQYNYFTNTVGDRLVNEIPVLVSDKDPANSSKAEISKKLVGVDYEMFTDNRYSTSISANGGFNLNVEGFLYPPLPFPFPWPNINYDESMTMLTVTNKIINRVGILKETIAFNEGSKVSTENKLFDAQTGKVLLTEVNNNFDKPIYSYTIPAHWKYEKMGAAYKNLGFTFEGTISGNIITVTKGIKHLVVGDECIAGSSKIIITSINVNTNKASFSTVSGTPSSPFMIIRSGRRNQLDVDVANVVALKDPTINRDVSNCDHNYDILTGTINSNQSCIDNSDFYDLDSISQLEIINKLFTDTIGYKTQIANSLMSSISGSNIYNYTLIPSSGYTNFYNNLEIVNVFVDSNSTICSTNNSLTPYYLSFTENNKCIKLFILEEDSIFCENNIINQRYLRDMFIYKYFNCDSTSAYKNLLNNSDNYINDEIRYSTFDNYPDSLSLDNFNFINSNWKIVSCGKSYPIYIAADCCPNDDNIGNQDTTTITISNEIYSLEDVLQVSANTFYDKWSRNFEFYKEKTLNKAKIETLNSLNEYQSGVKGIWRNDKSYAYLDNRKGIDPNAQFQNTQQTPNIGKDGTFNVFMFDWGLSPWNNDCAPGWIQTNKITRYNSYGQETENKDVLNNYSSALFGYKGSLPVAVSANSEYEEFGFESFEELPIGTNFTQYQNSEGNIDIYKNYENEPVINWEIPASNASFGTSHTNRILLNEPLPCSTYPIENSKLFIQSFVITTTENITKPRFNHAAGLNEQYRQELWGSLNAWQRNITPQASFHTPAAVNLALTIAIFNQICEDSCNATNLSSIPFPIYPFGTHPYSYYCENITTFGEYTTPEIVLENFNPLPNPIISNDLSIINSSTLSSDILILDNLNENIDCNTRESDIGLGYSWTGILSIPQDFSNTPTVGTAEYNGMSISSNIAHTGEQSMKITSPTKYIQKRLFFNPGEKYTLSTWVCHYSITNDFPNVTTYDDISLEIIQYDNCSGDTIPNSTQLALTSGPIINGWQKIELSFTMIKDYTLGSTTFNSNQIGLNFINGSTPAYFDDLRIHPNDATMQSYVYDPITYKLRATLDNNNYATLNYYDASGNLFLVKKETAKGIKTIQESRSFLKTNN